ncbi:hypothetical protein ACHAXR_007897 [Thalassiosira sp. AJA248-18]
MGMPRVQISMDVRFHRIMLPPCR